MEWDSDEEYLNFLTPTEREKELERRAWRAEQDAREKARRENPLKYLPAELECEWCGATITYGDGDFECTTIICVGCVETGKVQRKEQ